jgi:hypothetical protein
MEPRGEVTAGPAGPPPDEPAAGHAAADADGEDPADDWTWVIVRAVPHDQGLMRFDSLFEVTSYPCELLWGPGTASQAAAWMGRERPPGDTVDVLDRLFLVQHHGDRLYLPRSPEIALGLASPERAGTWFLIRADTAMAAFGHARSVVMGGNGCSRRGPCSSAPPRRSEEGRGERWQAPSLPSARNASRSRSPTRESYPSPAGPATIRSLAREAGPSATNDKPGRARHSSRRNGHNTVQHSNIRR